MSPEIRPLSAAETSPAEAPPTADFSRRKFLLHTMLGVSGTAALPALTAVLPGLIVLPSTALAADESAPHPTSSVMKVDTTKPVEYAIKVAEQQASPDGRPRTVFAYDGKIPGPVIRAKEGQTLKIKVANQLKVPTSIHWHGMHQPGTWQMDGVDPVSHAPIPPGQEFTYEFKATPAGSHWYHSHTGVQYSDGLFGPLIVDEPTPPAKYDREEIIFMNDWFLQQSDAILAGLLKTAEPKPTADNKMNMAKTGDAKSPATNDTAAKPTTGGTTSVMVSSKDAKASAIDAKSGTAAMTGPSGMAGMKSAGTQAGQGMAMSAKPDYGDVPFQSGLINGMGRFGSSTADLATIKIKRGETLRLRLISGASTYQFRFQVDGHPLTVIATDGAPMQPVEVDSLLLSPGERYDVLLKGTGNKSTWIRAVTLDGNEVKAILLYTDGETGEIPAAPVVWGKRELTPVQMKSPAPVKLANQPQEIKLTLGGTMSPYAWNINAQQFPQADPIKLTTNQPVRFIMENPTMMDHPFHLHGHYFYVLGQPDKLNLTDPPKKDSVNVPRNSTLVLQWLADNPGNWFYHCHIEWHLATGMARVIEIS